MSLVVPLVAALVLALAPAAVGQDEKCTQQTIEVGIVKAVGCWTRSTNAQANTIYTAAFKDQAKYVGANGDVRGVDLNGFVVSDGLSGGGGLQINVNTREVDSITLATGSPKRVDLNSRNWPAAGQVREIGTGAVLDFTAPERSPLLLHDLQLGFDVAAFKALAGLSPYGGVTTLVMLEPGGTGSMDLTVNLAGSFTLKGKPQSVTIDLPTSSGEGTKLDGFTINLEQIDSINAIKIYNLHARYSAQQQLIAGALNLGFPFFKQGVGVGGNFALQNGVLTELGVSVHGTKISIGGAGFLTDLAGGFRFAGVAKADFPGLRPEAFKCRRKRGNSRYCRSLGYDSFSGGNCHRGSTRFGINSTTACVWQTGNPSASARYTDPNDESSWKERSARAELRRERAGCSTRRIRSAHSVDAPTGSRERQRAVAPLRRRGAIYLEDVARRWTECAGRMRIVGSFPGHFGDISRVGTAPTRPQVAGLRGFSLARPGFEPGRDGL